MPTFAAAGFLAQEAVDAKGFIKHLTGCSPRVRALQFSYTIDAVNHSVLASRFTHTQQPSS